MPCILPLHNMGTRTGIPSEESEVSIYVWDSDTSAGQVPLTIWVDPLWLLLGDDIFAVNKVTIINSTLQDSDPSEVLLSLDDNVAA